MTPYPSETLAAFCGFGRNVHAEDPFHVFHIVLLFRFFLCDHALRSSRNWAARGDRSESFELGMLCEVPIMALIRS